MRDTHQKRLALFLDGTWNDPTDNTNVWRLKTLVAPCDELGTQQLVYYGTGVGTRWHDRIRGGVAAYGLSENVLDAYRWLVEHHDEGNEIFVYGFSRGAFTARSLVGLVAACGLLRPGSAMNADEVFDRYRQRADVTPLHQLEFQKNGGRNEFEADDQWLLDNSRRVSIDFIGIWDTVGTLGVPFGSIPGVSRRKLTFHNTRLSTIFKRGCHALAVDEHRAPYDASLWTNFLPFNHSGGVVPERRAAVYHPDFEQRWFVGAHGNVGGGYRRDRLAQIPLRWIQQESCKAGLAFRRHIELSGDEHLREPVVDSYAEFLSGLYRAVRMGRRYYREIGRAAVPVERGLVETVNETIDRTVVERWQSDANYRPSNVAAWARSREVDLDKLVVREPAVPVSDAVFG